MRSRLDDLARAWFAVNADGETEDLAESLAEFLQSVENDTIERVALECDRISNALATTPKGAIGSATVALMAVRIRLLKHRPKKEAQSVTGE